jgi:2-polyprenyl-6-methoxyphenol hydroxylase-like FAD-dependent oxidoreductase
VALTDTDVLIAGAGPTGLVLALWLARSGVRVRIVDRLAEPGTTSRALVVHARTLELYRQLGIAGRVIADGLPFAAANLWARGRLAGRIVFGDLGAGLTPFPYVVIYPQDEHERMLIDALADAGVQVERPVELLDLLDGGAGAPKDEAIVARLRGADGRDERCTARYVVGCDGAHSQVRAAMGAQFPGGTYSRMFYVADVEAEGPVMNGELHAALDEADFVAVFPLAGDARARLIGTVRDDAIAPERTLEWSDVSAAALTRMRIVVRRVNWFSTYRVHHRVADTFRRGRAFIAGDAAHIHSPVGGQGMNTGIGDAVNLAWKLAAVVNGGAEPRLLDTYEPERIAFARRLVETTDRGFTLVTSDGALARFVRLDVVPRLLPRVVALRRVRRLMFKLISQTAIEYRASPLSRGRAGRVEGGDRLPWVPGPGDDIHAPLASRDWQVHVHGEAGSAIRQCCAERSIPLHVFAWSDAADRAGLARDAVYVVRPDGYVGFADGDARASRLAAYLGLVCR